MTDAKQALEVVERLKAHADVLKLDFPIMHRMRAYLTTHPAQPEGEGHE